MPRKPEYDRNDVLERAASAFIHHGYEGASMSLLLEATGLSKSSLYAGFGDKRSLYLAAYDHFRATGTEGFLGLMASHRPPHGIRAVLEAGMAGRRIGDRDLACMTATQSAERGGQDPQVRRRIAEDQTMFVRAVAEHVREAQASGRVDAALDVEAFAWTVWRIYASIQLDLHAGVLDRARTLATLDHVLRPVESAAAADVSAGPEGPHQPSPTAAR